MSWEIGWTPKGWIKGDNLGVKPAIKQWDGRRLYGCIYHLPLDFNRQIGMDDIAAVSFEYEIADKVQTWLDWWYTE